MKISELISKAQDALKEIGDADVVMMTDTPDGLFYFEYEPEVEIIQIPDDEKGEEFSDPVLVISWPDIVGDEESPKLKIVKDEEDARIKQN